MNIILCTLQILLALHTAVGAVWKFSNPAQAVPSLAAIPAGAWLALSIVELLCSVALVVPFLNKSWSPLVPFAATCIAVEMLLFCGVHLFSGDPQHGHLVYWLVVAAVCGFAAYGRYALKPV